MKALNLVTLGLVIFGGLNLGLAGAARFDLIIAMFGDASATAAVLRGLIGAAALWQLALLVQALGETGRARPARQETRLT